MPSIWDTVHFAPYHILLYFHNWLHRGHPYCVISITAMSDSLPSTSHSQKIQLTISEFTPIVTLECPIVQGFEINTRYTCVNLHRNPLPSPRLYPLKYSWVEKAQDVSPRLLSLLPFLTFHHVRQPPIQPYTTAIIQTLYHIFSSICQSFSTSRWWLGFHLTSVSMPLHLRPHHLAAIHLCRPNKEPVECKYNGIIVHSGICHRY